MLLPNCKLTAGHNTHQNGMYIGNSILKNHYCQYMDTLKHCRVYKTLPRILQQISDENRRLGRIVVILKYGGFLMQNIRKCKNSHKFLHLFCLFLNVVMKSVSTKSFKSQAKANHHFGENLIARGVN